MSATVAAEADGATGSKGGSKGKQSKNAFRRAKKKAEKSDAPTIALQRDSKAAVENEQAAPTTDGTTNHVTRNDSEPSSSSRPAKTEDDDELEYDQMGAPEVGDPLYAEFQDILARFGNDKKEAAETQEPDKGAIFYEDDNDDIPDEEAEEEAKMSRKKRKAMNKLSVAELKSVVRRPELVEWTDTSAPDPRLLISIKGARNVVPVPSHWSLKREYLSSKRGIEKAHFSLPKFIAETGIAEMRDAALEKDADKSLKQKQRDRVAPKMGKLDIDYQKLYEAFFKHQTKPELTRYGEVYYEGKEYETNLRHLRPGELSDSLHEALGMPLGSPPPWLVSMQRFGPPPGYPSLKIMGVNAPIPPGARWGFGQGEWGKPALDDHGRPLYGGDVFGSLVDEPTRGAELPPVDKTIWGELQAREEESEEEEEEDEDDGDAGDEEDEDAVADREGPTFDRSGMASSAPTEIGGVESIGGDFTLRKDAGRTSGGAGAAARAGTATEEPPRQAYQVLDERSIQNKGFFGGERAYDLSQARAPILGQEHNTGRKRKGGPGGGDVDVAVDVDELERGGAGLSKDELRRRYDEGRREDGQWKGRVVDQDDLSQMIAEEGRKRVKKDAEDRERRRQGRR